jgi:hypothetical protein
MRVVRHPLVTHDLLALVDHIVEVTGGDIGAAVRRLDEIDLLLERIAANPLSGVRLGPPLDGWLVRHGGSGNRLTVVFRFDQNTEELFVALIAFGGQDWVALGEARSLPES